MSRMMLLTGCMALVACAHARSADQYRTDMSAALASRDADIKTCYDQVLAKNAAAAGHVTVRFAVQAKTGHITDVQVDNTQTTAPPEVGQCVAAALPAVTLSPADPKQGNATWSWDFQAGTAAVPAKP